MQALRAWVDARVLQAAVELEYLHDPGKPNHVAQRNN